MLQSLLFHRLFKQCVCSILRFYFFFFETGYLTVQPSYLTVKPKLAYPWTLDPPTLAFQDSIIYIYIYIPAILSYLFFSPYCPHTCDHEKSIKSLFQRSCYVSLERLCLWSWCFSIMLLIQIFILLLKFIFFYFYQ